MPKKNKNTKISLAELKKKHHEAKQPQPRRGRSRERRSRSISGDSRGSSVYSEDEAFDVEAVFEALYSCRNMDDVILSTTLFEQGVLPEHMGWAQKAFEAMQRQKKERSEKKKKKK